MGDRDKDKTWQWWWKNVGEKYRGNPDNPEIFLVHWDILVQNEKWTQKIFTSKVANFIFFNNYKKISSPSKFQQKFYGKKEEF